MSDAVSTIALGVETATGLAHVNELRAAFAGLKVEIRELNDLRASAQGITSGMSAAKNDLATLTAEMAKASSRISELENQIKGFGKAQVQSAKDTANAVRATVEEQARAVVDSEKRAASEVEAIAKRTTETLKQESAKRYAMGQSAKMGDVSYSMKGTSSETEFARAVTAAEAKRREILANSQSILIADIDRAEAKRREVLANSQAIQIAEIDRAEALKREKVAVTQAMQMAEIDRAEAIKREKNATTQAMLIAQIDRDEARKIEVARNARVMQMAEIDRAEALRIEKQRTANEMLIAEVERAETIRREKLASSQTMQMAEIDRAEALRREKLANSQAMQIAEIDRAEALKREKVAVTQAMQMAEIDRAEAMKREKNATAQAMLIAEIDRDEARKIEVARNARMMQMAEIDRAEAARVQKQRTSNEMLIAEIERAESLKAEITRNARAIQMAEIDRSDELRLQKLRAANEMLIAETKRAEEERQTILNARFQAATPTTRAGILRNAASLHGDGTDQRRVNLATNIYGSDAVSQINTVGQAEATLLNTRTRGREAVEQLTAVQQHHTQSMRDAHSAARGLAGGLGQLWVTYGSVIPLVAGAAVTGSMVKVFTAGKDVEYQLQFLRALADDLEKRPIDLDSFLKITDGTMTSVKDAAGGMRALAQAGLDQKQALAALPNVLDLAVIGEMSVGAAALTATGVVHAFGLELSQMGHVGDVFAKVAASSNTSVAAMTESMKSASTVGEMFNVKMEEAAASIGVLAQRNITGTSAGTALTTALKNLYEPTTKAAAALKAMNITTDDGHGGLKNYTDLLGELREKLSGLNDSSKAVFLGTITDQRGAKAISAITENMKDYKKFLDDANESTGFMSKATLELEDTVQGSLQRMSNSMEGSFIKAFKEASPSIRQVMTDLNNMAKSDQLVDMLSRLAVTAANLTRVFVENAGTIAAIAGFYALTKATSALIGGYISLRTTLELYTLRSRAAAAASGEAAVALTIEQQAAMAAGRGMLFAGASARFLTASFGPISLVVMGIVAAYELYHSKIEASDNAMKAANNTADTVLDYYDRQISKLRELNKELTDFAQNGTKAANDAAKVVLQSQFLAKSLEVKRLQDSGQGSAPVSFTDKALVGDRAETKLQKAKKELDEIGTKLIELDTKSQELQANQGLNKKLNDKKGVESRLNQLIRDAGGDESDPAGNAATKAMLPKILALKDEFKSSTEGYKLVAAKIVDYRKELNEKLGTFKAPDHHGESDAYRAAQAALDAKLQAIKDNERSKQSDIKSDLATHEIGDLVAIARNLDVVKKARQDELAVLREKRDLAKGEDKKAATQQIENKEASNKRADVEADREADRQRREVMARWAQDSLRSEAESLRRRGELVKAFQAEFDAKHDGDVQGTFRDMMSGRLSPEEYSKADNHLSQIATERDTGSQVARFNELQDKFDSLNNRMNEQLAGVSDKASQSNGFLSSVGAAQAADDIRNNLTPELQNTLQQMGQIANALNDNGLKASVSKMGSSLIKEADRSRAAWVATGKAIAQSLGDSFGKGGAAAGGVISALIRQRAAQKDIEEDLKRNKGDKDNQNPVKQLELENKAREESVQLQLSSYAAIAGAAKGFFDEHSKGYELMQTTERIYRAFETASAIQSFLMKSDLTTAFTSLFATSKATEAGVEAASVGTTVAAEGAKQGAYGITALAAALAKPYPYNLVAFATVAAMLASIGIAVSGGGAGASSVDVAKENQKYTGTGRTYDPSSNNNPYDWELQKSDSLGKALEKLKDNSDIALSYSSSQLNALQKISDGISGLTNSIVQSTGIRGTKADETALGVGSSRSFLGFSSSSTSLTDSGIQFGNSNIANILANGVNAQSYASTHSESKSFFGLSHSSSDKTTYGNLDGDLLQQMGAIVKSMYSSISDAAKYLGQSNETLQAALNSTSLGDAGLDKLSLKGLSSSEVETQLNAAFSKLGDVMAKKAMPGLEGFQQATESYLTTLVRVSSGIDAAKYSLEKLGVAAVDYTTISNKLGDVSTELVRESLRVKESSGGVVTGIGRIVETFNGSATDLADTYNKLRNIRKTMAATGLSKADVTSDMVRGAGGLDSLASGVEDFLDNFFTEAEKATAKTALLSDQFAALGVAMPKTKDGLKDLIQGIDRTTAAGQALYGALVSLSGQFNELADSSGKVDPAVSNQAALVAGLIDTAKHWLDIINSSKSLIDQLDDALSETGKADKTARIKDLQDLLVSGVGTFEQQLDLAGQLKDLVLEKYQTEKENAKDLIKFGRDLSKYVTELKSGDLSPLTNKGKLDNALVDYQKTLANTNSTDKDTRDEARNDIQGKASTLLDLAHEYYASSQGYTDIFNSVSNDLDKLGTTSLSAGLAEQKLSEGQLDELKALRALAEKIQGAAQSEYGSTVNQLAAQIQILGHMDGSLNAMVSLFASMPAELSAALAGKGVTLGGSVSVNNTTQDKIEAMYSKYLHRKSDASGMAFWMDAYATGKDTMASIEDQIKNSPEAKGEVVYVDGKLIPNPKVNGSHANGLDYVPFDGYVAQLHRGESVLTATEARTRRTDKAAMASTYSFSASEKAEMAAEIAELRKAQERTIEAVQEAAKAMVRAMGATSASSADKIVQGTKDALNSSDFDSKNKPVFR